MESKTEIVICLGSSCFSRGNKKIVKVIEQFLQDNNLKDKVKFKGTHCFKDCVNGPFIKMNESLYTIQDEDNALEVLNEFFNISLKK